MNRKWLIGGLLVASPCVSVVGFILSFALLFSSTSVQAACTNNGAVIVAPSGVQIHGHNVTAGGITLHQDQTRIASIAMGVGHTEHAMPRDVVVTIAASMQESGLRNLAGGDGDSLGVLQQTHFWGPAVERLDPVISFTKFYDSLLSKPNRNSGSLESEAIRVQNPDVSAYNSPTHNFDMWVPMAEALVAKFYQPSKPGTVPQQVAQDTGCAVGGNPNAKAERAIQAALSQIGKPYRWGNQSPSIGFDCSGLVWWAYDQAGYNWPRVSAAAQYNYGTHVNRDQLQRGDLVFWATNVGDPNTIDHVAIYLGDGEIVVAPHTGAFVEKEKMWYDVGSLHFIGGTRLVASSETVPTTQLKWQLPLSSGAITGELRAENGVDFVAPKDTLVLSAGDGTITAVRTNRLLGTYVRIADKKGNIFTYAHLHRFRKGVKPGVSVRSGEVIGEVGSTGAGIGDRLLFTVQAKNGTYLDPIQFLRAHGVRP